MSEFFRANVGAVIMNQRGQVLAVRRADVAEEAWQLPQGGIEAGEEPLQAIFREIREETGIEASALTFVAESSRWLAYELPGPYRSTKTGRGQTQKWYLFRFDGVDETICPGQSEVRDVRWLRWNELLRIVVEFRRPIYQELQREFGSLFHV